MSARLEISLSTKNNNTLNAEDIRVSPNPSFGIVSVDFSRLDDKIHSIRVFDLQGNLVYLKNAKESLRIILLNLDHLEKGIYFLSAVGTKKVLSQKIVIQ